MNFLPKTFSVKQIGLRPVQIAPEDTLSWAKVVVKAASANTEPVYIGFKDTVTPWTVAESDWYPLAANAEYTFPVDDPSKMYAVSDGDLGTSVDTTTASQWGLLINIDSATGTLTTATSWVTNAVEDEKFGIFIRSAGSSVGTSSGQFVTGAGGTWSRVFRFSISGLTNTWATYCRAANTPGAADATILLDNLSKRCFPVKPSTKYRFYNRMNVLSYTAVWTSPWIQMAFSSYNTAWTRQRNGFAGWASYTASTGWFINEIIEFTTTWTENFIDWELYMRSWNWSVDLDYNACNLEEVVEPVANSLTSSSPSLVSFTAVGSTDNIDQSQLTNTANVSFLNTAQYQAQQFTPTKSKFTWVILSKVASTWSPTWDMVFKIATDSADSPTSTILASYTMPSATYNALWATEFTVNLPCNLTAWTKYWLLVNYSISSATDYTRLWAVTPSSYTGWLFKYWTDWVTYGTTYNGDFYFKTLYYKPTTNFKASQNNSTVSISADEDGFQYWSVLNLSTWTYSFATPYSLTTWSTALLNQILCYSQTWLMTQSSPTDINWRFAHTIVFKVKIPLYATWRTANLIFGTLYNTTGQTVTYSYSYDNVTYYTAQTDTTAWLVSYLPNWLSIPITNDSPDWTLYIRYNNSGWDNRLYWVGMNTTIDTSSLSTLRNYPTNKDIVNVFTKSLTSATTTAIYRATKFGFPAIEYTNGDYQFLNIDTTATGSTVVFSSNWYTYTTVADWDSINIPSTVEPLIFVKMNITANRLYLSSNDYNTSTDKDGSNKMSVDTQVIDYGAGQDLFVTILP